MGGYLVPLGGFCVLFSPRMATDVVGVGCDTGGGGGIRTHGGLAPSTVFKTVAFNRSATPPREADEPVA